MGRYKKNRKTLKVIPHRDYIDKNVILTLYFPASKITPKDKINSIIPQFKSFLTIYSTKIREISRKFPKLKLFDYDIHPSKNNTYFMYLYTQPYNNHPFLIFGDMTKSYYQILLPLGSDIGQVPTKTLEPLLNLFTDIEITGIAVLLNRTIYIRKTNITENQQYSLYNCDQIRHCRGKIRELKKLNISLERKKQLITDYQREYKRKAKMVLHHYFDLLELNKYEQAYDYLKGGLTKGSPYFGHTRINTYFMSNRKVLGHLEVFIYLYKFKDKLDAIKNK